MAASRIGISLLLLVVLLPSAAGSEPPIPLDPRMLGYLADLLVTGSYGHHDMERAAFLIRGPAGECTCRLWRATAERRRETFEGTIPPGTFAIAHTHPAKLPDPSPTDHLVAEELGIPVLVVTVRGITAAVPGRSGRLVLLRDSRWSRRIEAAAGCVEPSRSGPVAGR